MAISFSNCKIRRYCVCILARNLHTSNIVSELKLLLTCSACADLFVFFISFQNLLEAAKLQAQASNSKQGKRLSAGKDNDAGPSIKKSNVDEASPSSEVDPLMDLMDSLFPESSCNEQPAENNQVNFGNIDRMLVPAAEASSREATLQPATSLQQSVSSEAYGRLENDYYDVMDDGDDDYHDEAYDDWYYGEPVDDPYHVE